MRGMPREMESFIMKDTRIAIIGQGRSGRDIHGAFLKSEANKFYNVVCVVEKDPARRELALKEYPGCEVFEDYTELFGRDDIDLVVNASYSEMHYPITKDLLIHGFNVLVEKPFARNRYECDDLIKTAKDNDVLLAVFQQSFFAPYYIFAKELIDSGKLGKIEQIDIKYNAFSRRWDWQTLQYKMAGHVYNTCPHPIGLALGFLDFDEDAYLAFSRLKVVHTEGDAEDFAKLIITAPGKLFVDIETNSLDAYPQTLMKIYGTKGTFKCNIGSYEMKYIVDGENPARPVIHESLKDENGMPAYCSEQLNFHEEKGDFSGTAFDSAVKTYYEMLHDSLKTGAPLKTTPEIAARVIGIIEKAHADNPLPVKY